jgi:putative tricarboxylic transport membrane protein
MFDVETMLATLKIMLSGWGLLILLSGTIVGMIFGAVPGLSGITALLVLIPVTFGMAPIDAMLLLAAAYGAGTYGGAVPAILINTPGEPPNAATILDGYPMTRQGKSGMALGAAATASTLGGFIGLIVYFCLLPLLSKMVMFFSYPEFFMMALFGLSIIAVLGEGSLLKGLAAGAFGILLSCVGYDPMTSELRYTFGIRFLWDGIQVVPALFGLMAIGEVMDLLIKKQTIARYDPSASSRSGVWTGVMATLKNPFVLIRCSALGTLMGAIPGVGGTVAGFISYMHAKQTCKNNENFGKGDVRGVIASEAANDAKEGGSLIPTLTFGIPGSPGMAVFLGALILHGIDTGQDIYIIHLDIVYMILLSLVGCHILAAMIGLTLADKMAMLTRLRPALFAPILLVVCLVGSFALRNNVGDVLVTCLFGFLGYEMRKFGFSRIALVLGLLLGKMAETSFRQTLLMEGGFFAFFTRPISLGLLILIIASVVAPQIKTYRRMKQNEGRA